MAQVYLGGTVLNQTWLGNTRINKTIFPGGIIATGGIISIDGDYIYHSFLDTGSFTFEVIETGAISGSNLIEYLIVAGGGAGGTGNNAEGKGGGGAGGLLSGSFVPTIGTYSGFVGDGGKPGNSATASLNGENSTFNNLTAISGGRGSGYCESISLSYEAANGGSGGGTSNAAAFPYAPGFGTVGQGNNGGDVDPDEPGAIGGGGGGAGSVGTEGFLGRFLDGAIMGIGGSGSLWLDGNYYAGGGGGGLDNNYSGVSETGGQGGIGGGGNSDNVGSSNATPNTGGGGGGGSAFSAQFPSSSAGKGGSGIVKLRYRYKNFIP